MCRRMDDAQDFSFSVCSAYTRGADMVFFEDQQKLDEWIEEQRACGVLHEWVYQGGDEYLAAVSAANTAAKKQAEAEESE